MSHFRRESELFAFPCAGLNFSSIHLTGLYLLLGYVGRRFDRLKGRGAAARERRKLIHGQPDCVRAEATRHNACVVRRDTCCGAIRFFAA